MHPYSKSPLSLVHVCRFDYAGVVRGTELWPKDWPRHMILWQRCKWPARRRQCYASQLRLEGTSVLSRLSSHAAAACGGVGALLDTVVQSNRK